MLNEIAEMLAELAAAETACRMWARECNRLEDLHGKESAEVESWREKWEPLWRRREDAVQALTAYAMGLSATGAEASL